MNAPRQGLFASLLIISFALHAVLIIHATSKQLSNTRAIQGELMTRQLAEDSLANLIPVDTVSLALLANRYSSRPDVAALKITANDGRVLTTGGAAPTRAGEVFHKKILLDKQPVGEIELTLIEPSFGEIIRDQWLPLLLAAFIHLLLWLLYRVIARPTRSEYLATLARERQLKEQVSALKLTVETAQKNAVIAQALAQQKKEGVAGQPAVPVPPAEVVPAQTAAFVLHISFADPKQLLGTLSPGLARPYFNLCQTLLEQAMEQTRQQMQVAVDCTLLQSFGENGAVVAVNQNEKTTTDNIALFLVKLGKLFNELTDIVYRRHREIKRFALHTRCAVTQQQVGHPAQALAQGLIQHVSSNELAVHVSDEQVLLVQQSFQLAPLTNPTDAQMREALMVIAMNVECARFVAQSRERILAGDKKAEPKAAVEPQSLPVTEE